MGLEPHVHCQECQAVIETTVIAKGGKGKPREVTVGNQNRLVPAPQGIAVVQVSVPICDSCRNRIVAAQEEAQAKCKLIVPSLEAMRRQSRARPH